jgi:hypothetical protein
MNDEWHDPGAAITGRDHATSAMVHLEPRRPTWPCMDGDSRLLNEVLDLLDKVLSIIRFGNKAAVIRNFIKRGSGAS